MKYINSTTKVDIKCKIHQFIFSQLPNDHLAGKGCLRCCIEKKKKSIESFIKEAINKHGDKYDYSFVKYINCKTKVDIKCNLHQEIFSQTPEMHLSGQGCPKCGIRKCNEVRTKSNEQFIKDAKKKHGDKYDYSKVEYISSTAKVEIICKTHGSFLQRAYQHIYGYGCQKCGSENTIRKTTMLNDDFIKKSIKTHGDKYDYSLTKYVNGKVKVKIICKTHGFFEQSPFSHIRGSGCPKCRNTCVSKQQIQWLEYIAKSNDIYIQHAMNAGEYKIGNYKADGYCAATRTIFEYQGCYYHGCIECYKPNKVNNINKKLMAELYNKTYLKEKFIKDKGYNLVTIWEHDWIKKIKAIKKIQKWWREMKNK